MTYFSFRRVRGARGEGVFEGSTFLGSVAQRRQWRSRLSLSDPGLDLYYAIGPGGESLSGSFPTRHDAAEALFALATGSSGGEQGFPLQA